MYKIIHNVETDTVTQIDLVGDELSAYEKDHALGIANQKIIQDELNAAAATKAALLSKLGITEDEARLLIK